MPSFRLFVVTALVLEATIFVSTATAQSPSAPQAPTLTLTASSAYFATPNSIRSGASILFSARLLPNDATGSLTFSLDDAPIQTFPVTQQSLGDFIAVGASATLAEYIGDPSQPYQTIVAQSLGLVPSTYASAAYTSCDALYYAVLPNGLGASTTTHSAYAVDLGANDMLQYGVGPNEALFNLCHSAALSWFGVPRQNKTLVGDPGVTVQSGNWTSAGAFGSCCIDALTSTSEGGTLQFQLATGGGSAYLWYQLQSDAAGSFSVSVDGVAAGVSTSTLFPANAETLPGCFSLLRIPVAAGFHTFNITAEAGTVAILGMGTAPPASADPPTVFATDVANNTDPQYTAAIAVFNQDMTGQIALLSADGLDIRLVPTDNFYFATSAETNANQQPNALGLAEFAEAFASTITPATVPAATIAVAGATYTSSAIPVGSHVVSVAYSGDAKYAPANATLTPLVIYDGTSTVALATGGGAFAAGSPVTLTATIPQTGSDGLVTFTDTTRGASTAIGQAWMNGPIAQLTLPKLAPGQHILLAQYAGDAVYNASASVAVPLTVIGTNTSTALTAPATRYAGGATIALSAALTPSTASGSVTFLDGANALAAVPLAAGAAAYSTGTLTVGIHSITASYSGDATDDPSLSPPLAIEIDPDPTTVALAPLPASSPYGAALTLIATVSGAATQSATPPDTVSFSDSFIAPGQTSATTQKLGTADVAGNSATLSLASLSPGSHSITATYSGDAINLPSISAPAVTQIVSAPTAITVAPISATIAYGTTTPVTATVTPASATGTITFSDSLAGTLGQATISNGSASFNMTAAMPGNQTISATYTGDADHAASTSAALSTTITQLASSIVLSPVAASLYAGNPLALSASIQPPTATGSVIFRDAVRGVLGQSTVIQGAASGSALGSAAYILTNPTAGAYTITATYSGDTGDAPATSAAIATQVLLNPVTATLTSSAPSANVGTAITLTATLSSASATGTIGFFDGTNLLGSAPVLNAQASVTIATLTAGVHTLSANYAGDTGDAPASASLSETIAAASSTTSLTLSQASVVAGTSVAVDVRVASAYPAPSGTIILRTGSTVLATGTLTNAAAGFAYATLTLNSANLGLGTFPLTASYAGDAYDSASASSPATLTVLAIPTVASLTLSANQVPVLGSVTLTAAVTSASPSISTGSATFLNGSQTVATVPLSASGSASYTFNSPPIGANVIRVSYAANGFFAAATSAPQSLTVTPPLSFYLNPAAVSAAAGQSISATLTATPLSGFSGAIQTACQTSAAYVSCSLNLPSSISRVLTAPIHVSVASTLAQALGHRNPAHAARPSHAAPRALAASACLQAFPQPPALLYLPLRLALSRRMRRRRHLLRRSHRYADRHRHHYRRRHLHQRQPCGTHHRLTARAPER